MSQQEKLQVLQNLFDEAKKKGLCSNQKGFAKLIGHDEGNLSCAFGGSPKHLTDNLIRKAELALYKAGTCVTVGGDTNQSPINVGGDQKNFGLQSQDIAQVVNTLCHEMAEQRQSYERLLMAALQGQKITTK